MTDKELQEILAELSESPSTFKTAIETYKNMSESDLKLELGKQIKQAKENFEKLDIMLEDLQWDIETELVNQILEKAIKVRHHPEIYIDHKNVIISLITKDLNQITDLDLQMARFITDVYDDTQFIMDI